MIIRKNNIKSSNKKSSKGSGNVIQPKGNVIKKEDLFSSDKNIESTDIEEKSKPRQQSFEKIDISSIEFKERIERRRGDRRRGYRRIDERSLVSRAQAEAHSIKELAAREGYQNGLNNAENEIKEIKNNLIEFLSMKDEMYNEFYPHILELSMEIAKKIIKKEIELSKDVIKEIIMAALDELNSDTEKITVKVNPEDAEFASVSLPEMLQEKGIRAKITIAADETVTKGSCILIANNGVIDADINTQLAILQNAFGIYKGGL